MRLSNKKICLILDVVTLLMVGVLAFVMLDGQPKLHYEVDRSVYPVKGIDVSSHNGVIDFAQVKSDSVSFVIIKATEGCDFCDAKFNDNYHKATDEGLLTGAYHYFRFSTPGHMQALHFINTIAGKTFRMPLAIDVERWGNNSDFNVDTVKAELRVLVDMIKQAGYPMVIYTNKKDYLTFIKDDFDDVPLWICSLSAQAPHSDWTYWQHSHAGHIKGIDSEVDINTYRGSDIDKFFEERSPYEVIAQ